jgi:hypothetical protein
MQRLGCGVGDELAPVGTPFLHSHQIGRCLEVSGVTSGKASGRDVTVKPPKNGYGESNEVIYLPLERGAGAAQPRAVVPAVTFGIYRFARTIRSLAGPNANNRASLRSGRRAARSSIATALSWR